MIRLPRSLRRFGGEMRGSASVELVIVLPLLLWALAATAVFFDGFKARYKAEAAAQTETPGAARSTCGPRIARRYTAPALSTAVTAITSG